MKFRDENFSICFLLNSFPNPSETFISGEAASMLDFRITPYIISLRPGDFSVVHPSAKILIEKGLVTYCKESTRCKSLKAIIKLFLNNPRRIFFCICKILFSDDRWLYFQAAPYAYTLLQNKTKFIHAHFADTNLRWASALSILTGIPFGVTTHGYDLREDPINISVASKLFFAADLIVTISEFNRNMMVKKYGISPEDIKIVRCGVDLNIFKPINKTDKYQQKKLHIINIGRLVAIKGQDILIRALSIAKNRGVEFECKIIGAGPLKNDLEQLVRSLDLENNFHFLGSKPQECIIENLQKSDVFVLSSRAEGLPVVCIEAMAMENVMIATRINGIPELVEDKVSGLLVDPDDVNSLADAICWVDQNRVYLEEMCLLARKKVEQEFDRKMCTEKLINYMAIEQRPKLPHEEG